MKVYLVSDGEYSDYYIVAVFSDKKTAAEAARSFYSGQVTEFDVLTEIPKPIRLFKRQGRIRNNTTVEVTNNSWVVTPWNGETWPEARLNNQTGSNFDRNGWWVVEGTNEKKVNKIYQDFDAEVRAHLEGIV